MPLLGKSIFVTVKALKDVPPNETVYTVPHTKEQFRTKKEFDKRNSWYKDRIWTCRCTGHVNLTHEEAWISEKAVRKTLKELFRYCHHKPVLDLVHHSTLPLDTLVDQAWLKLQQVISIGETVSLKVKSAGKTITGEVVKINTAGIEADPCSNCNSPSSDKENAGEDNDSPKKWQPPKLLPYKYSIKLTDEDRVINEIPAADLSRQEKPPSKENLRLFIRTHALRVGHTATGPWVVDDVKIKEFSLTQKFAHFLMSPMKTAEMTKENTENSKKRKLASPFASAAKKAKIDKGSSKKNTDHKKQMKLTKSPLKKSVSSSKMKSPKKKSPKKSPEFIMLTDSSSDEESKPLAEIKKMDKKGSSKGKSPKKMSSKNNSPKKNSSKKERTPKKSKSIVLDSDSDEDKPLSKLKGEDSDEDKPLSKLKNMKQMTLFEMSKKKGLKTPEKKKSLKGVKTPEKGMKTPEKKKIMSPPRTPAVVSKLVRAMKTEEQSKIKALVHQAATVLTPSQRNRLPAQVKDIVLKRFSFLEEKKKLARMSEEEKKKYMAEKKLAQKMKQREKEKELRKKFEDQDLDLKPLPQPKLVSTPDGLPNELFGDVAMVTEFVSCYSGLLMPDEAYPILTDALMKALSNGKEGYTYLSRALVVLLQTLLQDQISEDYEELKVPLHDIPVNPFTASELVRLCLRKQDMDMNDSDKEDEDAVDDEVSEDIVQLLETQELYQLDTTQKTNILKGLCLRIMGTYSVQDYMEAKQQESSQLWKRKIAELKSKNDKKRKEKEMKKGQNGNDGKEDTKGLALTHFYGKTGNPEDSKPSTPEPEPTSAESSEDVDDLASVVKRRRVRAAKAAAEKERRDEERRQMKEKEYEQYRKQREQENFEKTFNEGIALAKKLLRQSPIGTDRHHNRYWIFSNTTPGLFIEKGWVSDDISYSVRSNKKSTNDDDSDDSDDSATSTSNNTAEEKTVPHTGQNLWFTYDSLKDLDALIEKLHPQGIRESNLKAELKKRYSSISKAIIMGQRANNELRDSDGDHEMMEGLRKELMETELRLRHGGLGGVPDFHLWESKVDSAKDISVLGKCMIETQENVLDKFRQGIMGPKKKKVKVTEVNEENEDNKEEEEEEEKMEAVGIKAWREAVESSSTLSRLHMLLGVLDSCVKWEKSAENAKCKICRKKGGEDKLLLCDECNQAFHAFCLRPALIDIPQGDWFCAACVPQHQRRNRTGYYDDDSDNVDNENGIQHEENCVECGGDEELIKCSECPSAYHLECHQPPLRRPPRGQWVCNYCKTGVKRKTRSRSARKTAVKQNRAPPKRKVYKEESDEDSSGEEESSEEEEEKVPVKRGRTTKASRRARGRDDSDSEEEEEDDDNNDDEDSAEEEEPPKKKQKTARSSSTSRKNIGRKSTEKKNRGSTGSNTSLNESRTFTSRRAPSDLSICEQVIADTMKHESCWPFLAPVSKKDVPDYCKIIKHPMDFQLVKDKLSCLVYGCVEEVFEDVKQIFINAEIYNQGEDGSEILNCKEEVEKYFSNLVKRKLPLFLYCRGSPVANGFADHDDSPTSGGRRSRK